MASSGIAVDVLPSQLRKPSPFLTFTYILVGFAISLLVVMAPWIHSTVATVALNLVRHTAAAQAAGNETKPEWSKPSESDINDLDKVINGKGVWGFIYNSSQTPDDKYGIYNWCNMPHVRKQEYVVPDSEYELQYVEVVRV
jgi:hypothetical protein